MHNVIAISGLKGCGKNAFSRSIKKAIKNSNKEVKLKEFSYANRLKKASKIMWGLTDSQVNGSLKEAVDDRWGVTPRKILQHIGTEHARVLCNDVHKTLLEKDIKDWQNLKKGHNTVATITDLRFDNELDGCIDNRFTTVLLSRPGFVPEKPKWWQRLMGKKVHLSEKGLFHRAHEFDYVYHNDRGVEYWDYLAEITLQDLGIL